MLYGLTIWVWLQSNYDGHDYMDVKRHALDTLFKLLRDVEIANVPFMASADGMQC